MKKNSYLKNILTKELLEKEFEELKSSKAIGRKLGVSGETISKYMIDFGLNTNKKINHNCNHNLFSTDSEKSFYLVINIINLETYIIKLCKLNFFSFSITIIITFNITSSNITIVIIHFHCIAIS